MNRLVYLNLFLAFSWKTFIKITALFILLSSIEAFQLSHIARLESIQINIWDYLIPALGGMKNPALLWQYAGWVSKCVPILFLVYIISNLTNSYDLFLFTRCRSRTEWWNAKLISISLISFLYASWGLVIYFLLGSFIYPIEGKWSPYFLTMFPEAFQQYQPLLLLFITWLLFVLGTILLSILTLTVTILFKNTVSVYITVTILFFSAGKAYTDGYISRVRSPFHYPATIDWLQKKMILFHIISFDLMIILICIIVSIAHIRTFSYT